MRTDEFDIERMLINDRKKIDIDLEFKKNLKAHIMAQGKENGDNVIKLDKNNKRSSHKRYLKIASSFIIAAFVGGTFFSRAIGDHKINLGANKDKDNVMKVGEVVKITNLANVETKLSSDKKSTPNSQEMALGVETDSKDSKENSSEKTNTNETENQNTIAAVSNENQNNQNSQSNNDIVKDPEKENTIKDSQINKNESGNLALNSNKNNSTNNNDVSKSNTNNSKDDSDKFDDSKISDLLATESGKNAAGPPSAKGTGVDTPQIDDIKASSDGQKLNCYDARYSADGSELLINKNNSIYIKDVASGNTTLIVQADDSKQSFEKPNFMPNGNILYSKAISSDVKTISHAIYLYDINKKVEKKLVDGLNPMISKDGSKLTYEFNGKVYIRNMATAEVNSIDDGSFPSWSSNGKFLSYVKEQTEKVAYDENTEKKELYLEKRYSTIWIYNLGDKNKYRITNKEFVTDNSKIEQWANEVILGKTNHNFDMVGKYTYFESMWAENNKEIYVIRRDNERNMYEFIKFTLD